MRFVMSEISSNGYHYEFLRNFVAWLAQNLRKQDFLTYFKKLSLLEMHPNGRVVIGVVSEFARDNISHKFLRDLTLAAQSVS